MKNLNITNAEILNMEQLDNIAGGTINETSDDSKELFKFGLINDSFDKIDTFYSWKTVSKMVDEGWAKLGIHCVTKPLGDNCYTYKNQNLKRGEAILLAKKILGLDK